MCGICGFAGLPGDRAVLERMNHSLTHRGPDEDGYFLRDGIALAMRRLSILDLSSGSQPMANQDESIWTVFNGEIYNHADHRTELEARGHRFRTNHSDTEVVVHLFEEQGENWANRVNGMFGVALWDSREETLWLFRDRIGKKPLYYAEVAGGIAFGSEIKAVLAHPAVPQELDFGALWGYFGNKNTSAPDTAFASVKQLMPGQFLRWRKANGRVELKEYWKVDHAHPLEVTEKEAADHLLELLEDAVRIRMQCDAPYGAYLSGGVDSTAVVSMMSRLQNRPVVTFCLGYQDEAEGQFAGKASDIAHARDMSTQLGTEHHELILSSEDFAEGMSGVLRAFDEPFSGTVSTYFLSPLIREHVKVALSGDGADELHGSYLSHRLAFPVDRYLRLATQGQVSFDDLDTVTRETLRPFHTRSQFAFLQRVASASLAEHRDRLSVFPVRERAALLSEDFLAATGFPKVRDVFADLERDLRGKDPLARALEVDQQELLPNNVLPFVDRLSMAHSVEVRCPYLDYRVIEYSNRLPGSMKIQGDTVKAVHKRAMRALLPAELLKRPKEGFVQPIYSWMHSSLKDWVDSLLDVLPEDQFRRDSLVSLRSRFDAGERDVDARIWNLACYSLWHHKVKPR